MRHTAKHRSSGLVKQNLRGTAWDDQYRRLARAAKSLTV